jgi:hypothetical protein
MKLFKWITARNTTIQQILDNAQTAREVSDTYLGLISGGYEKMYSSWDNYSENFKGYTMKAASLINQIRPILNGMINEIHRLEKENEILKNNIDICQK